MSNLKSLGTSGARYEGLEVFDAPTGVQRVTLETDECCAICPVTSQPDWYTIRIEYTPTTKCVESKTFKLYIQSFKNSGLFCEQFAEKLATDISQAVETEVSATVIQKPRGGVSIVATATVGG